jgi:hypothetical protein
MSGEGLLLAITLLAQGAPSAPAPVSGPAIAAVMSDTRLSELSGLAASNRQRDRYWALNDSGGQPHLFLLDGRGRVLREVIVDGAENRDWEALESYQAGGKAWLLIGDIGDNGAVRDHVSLWRIEEPDPARRPSRSAHAERIDFRYEDGPRDSEAMTVDLARQEVLIISKRTVPPVLYRLPLAATGGVHVARRLAALEGIPQPSADEIARGGRVARFRAQVTAASLDCSGTGLMVLTYDGLHRYRREPGQDWAEALPGQVPATVPLRLLPQAEAMSFDATCRNLYVGSERVPVPWLRYRYRPLPQRADTGG